MGLPISGFAELTMFLQLYQTVVRIQNFKQVELMIQEKLAGRLK